MMDVATNALRRLTGRGAMKGHNADRIALGATTCALTLLSVWSSVKLTTPQSASSGACALRASRRSALLRRPQLNTTNGLVAGIVHEKQGERFYAASFGLEGSEAVVTSDSRSESKRISG